MTIIKVKKALRNEFCSCGSGKKNKNCCKIVSEYETINNSEENLVDNNASPEDNT